MRYPDTALFPPHLQYDACHISSDGGRVCRPLIICDAGVPRVQQHHIQRLKDGAWGFTDLIKQAQWRSPVDCRTRFVWEWQRLGIPTLQLPPAGP